MLEKKQNKRITIITLVILALGGAFIYFVNQTKTVLTEKDVPGADVPENRPVAVAEDAPILFADNGDGEKAYKVKRDGKWCVIFQGVEGKCYDSVSRPIFSPDGTQLAYAAETGGQWVVVLNNKEETIAYDGVSSIVFSPDGSRVAIVAEKDKKELVILDGGEGKAYEEILTLETWSGEVGQVIFSPDSEDVAYKVGEGDQEMVVINDEEGPKYDEVNNFDFSEDSDQFAYEADTGTEEVTVIDGHETANTNNTDVPAPPSSPAQADTAHSSSVSSGNANSSRPRFSVCEKNAATGEDCNF